MINKNAKIYTAHIKSPGWLLLLNDCNKNLRHARWMVAMGLHETLKIQGTYEVIYYVR